MLSEIYYTLIPGRRSIKTVYSLLCLDSFENTRERRKTEKETNITYSIFYYQLGFM